MSDIPKSSIYTKTGDAGNTSLYNGDRCSKSHAIFEILGTIDELNAHAGELCSRIFIAHGEHINHVTHDDSYCFKIAEKLGKMGGFLRSIQGYLLDLGSSVATPRDRTKSEFKLQRTAFEPKNLEILETEIDRMDADLPPLKNFILPGGSVIACQAHICRTVCRRLERLIVGFDASSLEPSVKPFVNRLSDYFFVLARYANHVTEIPDQVYRKE